MYVCVYNIDTFYKSIKSVRIEFQLEHNLYTSKLSTSTDYRESNLQGDKCAVVAD